MKHILLSFFCLSIFAAGEINPENKALSQEKISELDKQCKMSKGVTACNNALVLEMNTLYKIHRGVEKSVFTQELSGDWIDYLKEGVEQSDKMKENEDELAVSLDNNVFYGISEYRATEQLRHYSSLFEQFSSAYVGILNNTALLGVSGLKINTILLQDDFSEIIAEELKNARF